MNDKERQAVKEAKNKIAISKGYPDWDTMESWIIDHSYPQDVAMLLVSAMEDVLDELRKPSEDLIKEIEKVLESKKWRSMYHQRDMLDSSDFNIVATEIASLLTPQVNTELLENQEAFRKIIQAIDDEQYTTARIIADNELL